MEENNSQENAFENIELIRPIETAIDVNSISSETKSDILSRIKKHRENIDKIIVPQYIDDQYVNDNNYAVTYSNPFHNNSILGWNIEENEQLSDVYFKFDEDYNIYSFALYKKTLIFNYYDNGFCKYLY